MSHTLNQAASSGRDRHLIFAMLSRCIDRGEQLTGQLGVRRSTPGDPGYVVVGRFDGHVPSGDSGLKLDGVLFRCHAATVPPFGRWFRAEPNIAQAKPQR